MFVVHMAHRKLTERFVVPEDYKYATQKKKPICKQLTIVNQQGPQLRSADLVVAATGTYTQLASFNRATPLFYI